MQQRLEAAGVHDESRIERNEISLREMDRSLDELGANYD
jgi:hypothetical protein